MINLELIQDLFQNKFFVAIIEIIFFLGLVYVINFIVDRFAERIKKYNDDMEFIKQANTVKFIVKSVVSTVIGIFGGMYVLTRLGVDIRPLLTAAGVMGVAVGLGSKQFVEDLISGILIITEGQIRVGDVVEVAGKSGTVEKIDIKMVVLRDTSGHVHFIRNSVIGVVTNMTRDYSYYVFDISVAYKENIDRVIEVLKELDVEYREKSRHKHDIFGPLEIMGVDKLTDSAVVVKARYKTKPKKQWDIGRSFNKKYKNRFDELGIKMPQSQTINIGSH